jgi:hypothetical protein
METIHWYIERFKLWINPPKKYNNLLTELPKVKMTPDNYNDHDFYYYK